MELWSILVFSLLVAMTLAGLLAVARKASIDLGPVEVQTRWRMVIPREARFSVTQAAAWFGALPSLLDKSSLTLEITADRQSLQLFVAGPRAMERHLRAQLAAWFPEARLELASDEPAERSEVWQSLQLKKPELFTILTVENEEADPLLGVVGVLAHGQADSGFRLTVRPAPRGWKSWSRGALVSLKAGVTVWPRQWPAWLRIACELASHAVAPAAELSPTTLAAAIAKCRGPVLEAQLIIWASGQTPTAVSQVERVTAQLTSAFRDPTGNTLMPAGKPVAVEAGSRVQKAAAPWRVFGAAELASLFHLPSSDHPLIPTEPTRRMAPVNEVVGPGDKREHVTWVGEALTGEGTVPVGLNPEERRLHLYVVGKTGTGKSTFLAHLARQDLERGHGIALIDPHGDLAEQVLSLVPPRRHAEVLYFNAADTDHPVGLNLFHTRTPSERPLAGSSIVGVFKKLYGDSWGPRLEHFLRNAVLALLEAPAPSLLLLPRLLTDKPFRQRLLTHVRDPLLRTFFLEEYERYDPRWRAEAISPILNKVGQFLSAPAVRHIVGQSGLGVNLRELMDRRGIFIANLSSGRIGEDNCDLLGGLLVAGFQLAAMSRASQPEAERRDFYLLVDEFQHFANNAFIGILSEARKYRLALTLSHQYLDQVPAEISEAVFGNVGSLVAFRIGAGDVARIGKEFAPAFDGQDLVHLSNHHFCARLARRHGTAPAFSARTLAPAAAAGVSSELLALSRQRWARPRAEVELEIADAWDGRLPL